jgi:hypothetical protein
VLLAALDPLVVPFFLPFLAALVLLLLVLLLPTIVPLLLDPLLLAVVVVPVRRGEAGGHQKECGGRRQPPHQPELDPARATGSGDRGHQLVRTFCVRLHRCILSRAVWLWLVVTGGVAWSIPGQARAVHGGAHRDRHCNGRNNRSAAPRALR